MIIKTSKPTLKKPIKTYIDDLVNLKQLFLIEDLLLMLNITKKAMKRKLMKFTILIMI